MKTNEEFKAEVFSRKNKYIKKRKQHVRTATTVFAVFVLTGAVIAAVNLPDNVTDGADFASGEVNQGEITAAPQNTGETGLLLKITVTVQGVEKVFTADGSEKNAAELCTLLSEIRKSSFKADCTETDAPPKSNADGNSDDIIYGDISDSVICGSTKGNQTELVICDADGNNCSYILYENTLSFEDKTIILTPYDSSEINALISEITERRK